VYGPAASSSLKGMAADDGEIMWGSATELCTLPQLQQAQSALHAYDDVLRTPLLEGVSLGDGATGNGDTVRVSLKMESLQTAGSFKIRGMRYKLHVSDVAQLQSAGVVTLSAGNAGRAVSYLAQQSGIHAKVFMPDTAPDDRKALVSDAPLTPRPHPSCTPE
jgi:threonine dehydratase